MMSLIVQRLYESKEINKAISKMEPAQIRDDLKQEMFLALYKKEEKEPGFIERGDSEGWIRWWLIRTMLNMAATTHSTFQNMYRRCSIDNSSFNEFDVPCWLGDHDIEGDGSERPFYISATPSDTSEEEYHEMLHNVRKEVDGLHWYEKKVLELYAEGKNMRLLGKETGIPWRSLYYTVEKAKKKVKSQLKKGACPPPNCPR